MDTEPALDAKSIRSIARRALGSPDAVPGAWRVAPIAGPLRPTTRIYRVEGSARAGDADREWSAILKVVPHPATEEQAREVEVYRSGLLEALPEGLGAPRLLLMERRPDGAVWLWLEDVAEAEAAWDIPRYALAARHLGRLSAQQLAPGTLEGEPPYLSRGWLRGWIEANASAIANLASRQHDPLVRRAYPPEVASGVLGLWGRRGALLDGLDRLPQTLCHLDAHRGNLIGARRGGRRETVLLDWQFAGAGPIGADAAPLLGATVTEGFLPADEAGALEEAVYGGYLGGLAEGGWRGDERLTRAGYAGVAGLRYTLGATRFLLPMLLNAAEGGGLCAALGTTVDDLAHTMARLFPLFLALAAEAETLLAALAAEGGAAPGS